MSKVSVIFDECNSSTYFCDWCYKETLNSIDYSIYREYFNCKGKNDFIRHLKSAKHLKHKQKAEDAEDKIECKECNFCFTPEGYNNHCKRNNELWNTPTIVKKLESFKHVNCNNFVFDKNKRFTSIQAYKDSVEMKSEKQPKLKKKKTFKVKMVKS